ncbi:hypothetical protein [Marinobacter sp. S6332]|uniref:hypothetical protein n=1 Tax=Marinobacter sp. S6332 TaxID=2926403 RepID=UPI001FF1E8D0|nr:hypothetical protein [Marinobacter sp. S6332]MCK0165907.1 hypothetical protein [Marinobacter sp. S6332]
MNLTDEDIKVWNEITDVMNDDDEDKAVELIKAAPIAVLKVADEEGRFLSDYAQNDYVMDRVVAVIAERGGYVED